MGAVGQPERATQSRVITLFCDELGYRYLGDWTDQNRLDEKLVKRLDETCAAIVPFLWYFQQNIAVFLKNMSCCSHATN